MPALKPQPRPSVARAREVSYLASPLNFDSRAHLWKQVGEVQRRGKSLNDQSALLTRQLQALLRHAPGVASGFHPFKIYPPSVSWFNSPGGTQEGTNGKLWRTWRVRNGLVCTTHAKGIDVDGTDKVDLPYDQMCMFQKDGTTAITDIQEYVVNTGLEFFYFWVEVYTSSGVDHAVLRYGPDPTVATYTDPDSINPTWTSTNPWTNWDTPDSSHFLIGFADTMSQASRKVCLIRQILVTDILVSAVGNTNCPYGVLVGLASLAISIFGMMIT